MTMQPFHSEAVELRDEAAAGIAGDRTRPSIVRNLDELLEQETKFSTIYADPPWPYRNTAARGAAENHYRTMTLEDICAMPARTLAAENAHLHIWTTNAFLREAFDVIRAWGFCYKSCLVWIKPQLGMGNYWRVSHEYLLLGVRGNLPFREHTYRSWVMAQRTIHSRKPFVFRALIERVSPGPYLELFGREEQPNTGWTIFGNQVERRLF
jgi:N6-adenosine-specific RNA methylase IME4